MNINVGSPGIAANGSSPARAALVPVLSSAQESAGVTNVPVDVAEVSGGSAAVSDKKLEDCPRGVCTTSVLNQLVASAGLDPLTRVTLYRDLSQFPLPWLETMQHNGLRIAVLQDGQTLADSPALAKFVVPGAAEKIQATKSLFREALSQVGEPSWDLNQTLAENIQNYLLDNKSPIRLAVSSKPVNLDQLCVWRRVPPAHRQAWKEQILDLNASWCSPEAEPNHVKGNYDFLLLPPIPTDAGPVADGAFQQAMDVTASYVAKSLGINNGPDRLVLLHSKFLGENAPELGGYRVAIHEMGHGLDYILEGLSAETGFGRLHTSKVEELYHGAQERGLFTSDYAKSNVREYFAESVEAFLTGPGPNDVFRSENNRDILRQRDPEMTAYLERIFAAQPGQDWKSIPPAEPPQPRGTPCPETDALYLDDLR